MSRSIASSLNGTPRPVIEPLEPRQLLSALYSVTDLSSPLSSDVISLNNSGQMLSDSGQALTIGGSSTLLSKLSHRLSEADPLLIDDAGQILGAVRGQVIGGYNVPPSFDFFGGGFSGGYSVHFYLPQAFVLSGKKLRILGEGFATASNHSGQIVGVTINKDIDKGGGEWTFYGTKNGYFKGIASGIFLYANGKRHNLPLPAGVPATSIVGVGIDDAGEVMLAANGIYLYAAGSNNATQISPLAFDNVVMNPGGQIAGTISGHAYTVNVHGQTTDWGSLGAGGSVSGVNASGQIVGQVNSATAIYACASQDGAIVNINTLSPPRTFSSAYAINDLGQIAVGGYSSTFTSNTFLLTPPGVTPPPAPPAPQCDLAVAFKTLPTLQSLNAHRPNVAITVTNIGQAIADGPLDIRMGYQLVSTGTMTESDYPVTRKIHLKPGKSVNFQVYGDTSLVSAYYPTVTINPSLEMNESNTTNNTAISPQAVPPSEVDLTIAFNSIPSPWTLDSHHPLIVTVTNQGNTDGYGVVVIWVSGDEASPAGTDDGTSIDRLASLFKLTHIKAGQSLIFRITKSNLGHATSSFFPTVTVDPQNSFYESNMANNEAISPTLVTPI